MPSGGYGSCLEAPRVRHWALATNDTKVHTRDAQLPPIPMPHKRWCAAPGAALQLPGRVFELFAAALDLQVVLHRKYIRHTVGSDVRHILIALAINQAFERDVSIFHNNMN